MVTLSGLDSNLVYNFHMLASTGSISGITPASAAWTITGANSKSTSTDSILNNTTFASILGIVPDGAGEITIVFSGIGDTDRGHWNTLEFVVVPEPSTLVLLLTLLVCLVGAGAVSRVRRRRRC